MQNKDLVVEKSSNEVQAVPANQLPVTQADKLLELAITKGADMAQIEKLMDLKERYDKEEARKAFTAAMAAFNTESITIKKDKTVGFAAKDEGKADISYMHATLGNITKMVVPALALHGLSTRWDVQQKDARVHVSCILSHAMGHSESVTMDASPDDTGKKNTIQQVSSTVSYLQRYTFLAVTGQAVEEADDDGKASGPAIEYISGKEVEKINSLISDNKLDKAIFLKWAKVEQVSDIKSDNFKKAIKGINDSIKKKNKA